MPLRFNTVLWLAVLVVSAWRAATMAAENADILLVNGLVIDGSGSPAQMRDLAIRGDRIEAIGVLQNVSAVWSIDCMGLVICPGFIDLHNHSDGQIVEPATRSAVNYVTQGCTTIVTGNCGSGPVDASDYYSRIDRHGAGVNVAHLLPQGSLRRHVVGTTNVPATSEQMQQMLDAADQAMRDGAWGMSTGLIYVPSSYATTDELIALATVVSSHGGIYASHIRGEGTTLLNSVNEALKIGEVAGLPVHVSHFKSSGRDAWGLVREAVRMIAERRSRGQQVTADQYPYVASSTSLGATLLPASAREGGTRELTERLDDPKTGPQLRETLRQAIEKRDDGRDVRIARYAPNQSWVGLSLADIAVRESTAVTEIAEEILRNGGAQIVHFSMNENDVRHVMAIDWVATASDGRAYLPGSDRPHPRNYGTFPRKLGHYAIREDVISMEAAVRSMTSLPADILKMKDRGRLTVGNAADITVFNPDTLRDAATFDDPHQYSRGIEYVFVNGTPALVKGQVTGALAGKALRFHSSGPQNAQTRTAE